MGAVTLLAAAGARRRLGSLLLTGLVIALAAAGLTASIAVRASAADVVDAAFGEGNGADLVAVTEAADAGDLAATLRRLPEVVAVAEPVPVVDARLGAGDEHVDVDLRAIVDRDATVNAPQLTGGRLPLTAGEAVLDTGVARAFGIDVGDRVEVVIEGTPTTLEVVGLAYDFTDCFYPTCDPGHVWVLPPTFEAVTAGASVTMMTAVDLRRPSDADEVWATIGGALGGRLLGGNDWLDTRGDLLVENLFFGAFIGAFGVFVMVGSAIVIGAAITARTAARRRAVAICKATGCSNGQVTAALVAEQLVIATVAAALGWAAGTLLAPRLRIGSLRIVDGAATDWSVGTLAVVLGVTAGVVLVATLVPAWRAGRVDLVDALADRPASQRRARLGGVSSGIPLTIVLGWRSATARPLRTILAASGVALAVVAAVVTIGIDRSVSNIVDHPALAGDPYHVAVSPYDQSQLDRVVAELEQTRGVDGWFSVADDRGRIDGTNIHVRAIGGDLGNAGFVIGEGRTIAGPGEAIAGFGALAANGWSVGDQLDVEIDGVRFPVRLVGWYRETEDSGEIVQIALDDLQRARPDAPVALAVVADPGTSATELGRRLATGLGGDADVRVNETDDDQIRPFRVAMTTMTVLLAAIVLAHLAAMTLTAARQRAHRTSVLRAMGFTPALLRAEAAAHGLIVGAIGGGVGLLAGWPAQQLVGDALTSALGAGPGMTLTPTTTQLALIVVVAIAAATVSDTASGVRHPVG